MALANGGYWTTNAQSEIELIATERDLWRRGLRGIEILLLITNQIVPFN